MTTLLRALRRCNCAVPLNSMVTVTLQFYLENRALSTGMHSMLATASRDFVTLLRLAEMPRQLPLVCTFSLLQSTFPGAANFLAFNWRGSALSESQSLHCHELINGNDAAERGGV